MKSLFITLITLITLTSCHTQTKHQDKPLITVTIEPLRYFTEAIAGDHFQVNSLVPQGASPESYDPTPSQLMNLAKSQAYFKVGHLGFELAWMDKLMENAPHVQFFDMSEGMDLIANVEECHDETHQHENGNHTHHHGVIDPHTWNSASNASIIADNILNALITMDNEHQDEYIQRHYQLTLQIEQTDSLICHTLSSAGVDHSFMIYHPALTYFANDYGLHQIPIELDGKEPSPAHLKELIDRCKKEKVRIIFVQPEFDKRHAEIIAKQTGTTVVPINPLSYDWKEEMIKIANSLTHPQ